MTKPLRNFHRCPKVGPDDLPYCANENFSRAAFYRRISRSIYRRGTRRVRSFVPRDRSTPAKYGRGDRSSTLDKYGRGDRSSTLASSHWTAGIYGSTGRWRSV